MLSSVMGGLQPNKPVVSPMPGMPAMIGGGIGSSGGAGGGQPIPLPSLLSPDDIGSALEALRRRLGLRAREWL